jgi:16S rRNA processing protein RimM
MSKKITIAKIISVFGIKGEVKIAVYSDDVLNIEKYPLFDSAGRSLKVKISNKNKAVVGTASGDPIVIAKIEGVNDRNESEKLRGAELFAERKNFAKTSKDEFYYVDLIGLDVIDEKSKKIGRVINVFDHGAGGILEIEFDAKSLPKNYNKIENFSFKNAIFPEVNLEEKFIRIDLPEIVSLKKEGAELEAE